MSRPRLLVVTAVTAESAAVHRGLSTSDSDLVAVIESGVGVANAAAATAEALRDRHDVRAVICAGIAGGFIAAAPRPQPNTGFEPEVRQGRMPTVRVDESGHGHGPGVAIGGLVVGSRCVAADLGADSPEGFLSVDRLGFGSSTLECDAKLVTVLRTALADAAVGSVLTVSTVTGSAERALELHARHPDAVAEAMEGFGVATAAARAGVPFVEVRSISNVVGPRDRSAWRITDALAALQRLGPALASLVE